MNPYVRPPIDAPIFRDASGAIIDYGRRWEESPPEDTYSVETHLERFAPLHEVAAALIEHLRRTYDVEVEEGVVGASDLLHPKPDIVRAVRIRPRDPACAALTFVFTAYPAVYVHAGLLHDFYYPVCGCDACDSTWDGEADDLEKQVFAVVTGNYRENVERGFNPWVGYASTFPDGGARSGRSRDASKERITAAKRILRDLPGGWAAWPLKPDGA